MRHNSSYNNLLNNNKAPTSIIDSGTTARYLNVDNTFDLSPVYAPPSHKHLSHMPKQLKGRDLNNPSYGSPVNFASNYTESYLRSYDQRQEHNSPVTRSRKERYINGAQPQQHHSRRASSNYYTLPQYAMGNVHPESPTYEQRELFTMEQDRMQKHVKGHIHAHESHKYRSNNSLAFSSPEQTWDSILAERPSHSTDQHYEHYFSYFYNSAPDKFKRSFESAGNRNLPMSVAKSGQSKRDSRAIDTRVVRSVITGDVSGDGSPTRDSHYVLKEKLPNNNLPIGYDPYSEAYDESSKTKGEQYLQFGDIYDNQEFNNSPYDSSGLLHRNQYLKSAELHDVIAVDGACLHNNNNKLHSPIQIHATPRLPLTPKKVRGKTTPKKILPTVHRVLLYNNQSPRMARKQLSLLTRQNMKRQTSSKRPIDLDEAPTVILLHADSKPNDNRQLSPYDDPDFDEDDNLDNVSNFDESDGISISSDTEEGYRAHAYKLTHLMDRFSSSQSTPSSMFSQSSEDDMKNPASLLVESLFPHVPPYLSFSSNTKKGPRVPAELHRVLKWRVTNIMPKVVRLILANSGMRMLKKTNDWMGVWGKHLKSPCFKTIRSYQKINHLPGSFRIGRKDSCWKNLHRQMNKHSHKEFGFMPRTFIIPNDLAALRKHWPKYAQRNTKWIIKPPASARGAGIRVVNRWGQIPKRRPLIVQKYIERPLLINGSKFDLRLYVLVTSVNPLRVFMYHNGLARFASVKYSARADTLNDRCMHLTNYSINKFSSNYSKNEDVNACHGHKWTIKSLWTYLANRGVRTDNLWEALRALVLRTILAGENGINNMIRANVESKYSCFELFGFDVILDSDLVPWLLEVNISPSLHSELPLDAHVKAPLVQGVLNTALYNVPPKLSQEKQRELAAEYEFPPGTQICYDKRLYINYLSREEKAKHTAFTRKSMENREEYINAILQKLTPDDIRCLIVAEDELARCAPLERIFPTDQTHKYLKYNDTPRYYNRLLDAWEARYAKNRDEGIALLRSYCQSKYHLQVPAPSAKKVSNGNGDEMAEKPQLHSDDENRDFNGTNKH